MTEMSLECIEDESSGDAVLVPVESSCPPGKGIPAVDPTTTFDMAERLRLMIALYLYLYLLELEGV